MLSLTKKRTTMTHYDQALAILVFLTMLTFTARASASRADDKSMFIHSLQDDKKYDKRLRPYHRERTLNVTVGMTIVTFGEINEIEGEFSLDIFFFQKWIDPRLRHNAGSIILSGIHKDLIWLPDTFFFNIKTSTTHDVPSRASDVKIQQNGEVRYSKRITLSAGCEIDLHRYPLDTQICNLRIMSYGHEKGEIEYHWKGDGNEDIYVMNNHMAQMIVTNIQRIKTTANFSEGLVQYSELAASFEFQRRLGYSLIQVYAPAFLIVTLSWLSFWISKNAVPARVALGITTMLTIVTLNGSFRSTVPKVSYIKALDLYMIISFLFVFGAVLEYIAVLLFHDYAVQSNVKKAKNEEQEEKGETANANQEIDATGSSVERSTNSHDTTSEASTQPSPSNPTRNNAKAVDFLRNIISVNSTPIDKISKFAFPFSFVVFNILYWICYSTI